MFIPLSRESHKITSASNPHPREESHVRPSWWTLHRIARICPIPPHLGVLITIRGLFDKFAHVENSKTPGPGLVVTLLGRRPTTTIKGGDVIIDDLIDSLLDDLCLGLLLDQTKFKRRGQIVFGGILLRPFPFWIKVGSEVVCECACARFVFSKRLGLSSLGPSFRLGRKSQVKRSIH